MGSSGGSTSTPAPRDLKGETSSLLSVQKQAGKDQIDLAQALVEMYPQLAKYEREATTAQRGQDVTDLAKSGPGYMAAYRAVSPTYGASEDALTAEINRGQTTSPLLEKLNADAMGAGASPLRSELERQALGELGLGRSLSPEELRASDQATRSAMSARGMVMSSPAIAEEILNRDAAGTAREAGRRSFAGSVAGLGMSEDQANRSFQTAVQSANEAGAGNWRNFLGSAMQIGGNSPVLGMMGQRTPVPVTAPASLLGAVSSATAPVWSYGSDLFNTNFNAAYSTGASSGGGMSQGARALAGAGSGALSGGVAGSSFGPYGTAIGAVVGAGVGAVGGYYCWVAREIFGAEDWRWAWFRLWLDREAPAWFRALYIRFGSLAAALLHELPSLKQWLEPWFDRRAWKMRAAATSADWRRVRAIFNEYQLTRELPPDAVRLTMQQPRET